MTTKTQNYINILFDITDKAKSNEIAYQFVDSKSINDANLYIKDKKYINFGSCSYLGLEFDERLKKGAIDAINMYGTQFSSSRAYVAVGLYRQIEEKMKAIFGSETIVFPSVTSAHIGSIQMIVDEGDAILYDHQVHTSVQTGINIAKARSSKTIVEVIRHNDMVKLEEKILELSKKCRNIWYMADGVYSMYGDYAPLEVLYDLMVKYPQFHVYVDDAHGMSCFGKNGCGYVLSKIRHHERLVIATSFAKAFATGGGALVINNPDLFRKVERCSTTLITSGPLQPANLGAISACCDIHLSDEIYTLQENLSARTKYCKLLLDKTNLPLVKDCESPVFFVGVGSPQHGILLTKRLKDRGFFTNIGIFPAVPIKNTGVRFTITNNLTYNDIQTFVEVLNDEYNKLLLEFDIDLKRIHKNFNLKAKVADIQYGDLTIKKTLNVEKHVYSSIFDVSKSEWNSVFKDKGTFDWEGMSLLEMTFNNNNLPENNWKFHYIVIKDLKENIISACPSTISILKDDMLFDKSVSQYVEKQRQHHKYYLTSKMLSTGSPVSEGEHLYINKNNKYWREGLLSLLDALQEIYLEEACDGIMLRDFYGEDNEVQQIITNYGYFKNVLPDTHYQNIESWKDASGFYESLKGRKKDHFNSYVGKFEHLFEYKVEECPDIQDIIHWYKLYRNVKDNNLELNTFDLPLRFFTNIANSASWEICTLRLKSNNEVVAVSFNHIGETVYSPLLIGLNYNYLHEYSTYRQSIYRMILRAKELGKLQINLGFSASLPKRSLNCQHSSCYSFVQLKDHFNTDYLISIQAKAEMQYEQARKRK